MILGRNRIFFYKCRTNFISIILVMILFASCEDDKKIPGYEYSSDMVYSVAYENYDPNPNFSDGKTTQQPVEGTIPREMITYQYPKTNEGKKLAGLELSNPFEL